MNNEIDEVPEMPAVPSSASTVASYASTDPPAWNASSARTRIVPGIGKVLGFPTQDACDVDAFVEKGNDDDDVDGFTATTNSIGLFDDLESNGQRVPRKLSVRVIEPPLDPSVDPFTPRVGKTLVWRNVNMTLVSTGTSVC